MSSITRQDIENLMEYIAAFGGLHVGGDCPEDDTCNCAGKPINDSVTNVCRYLHDLPALLAAKDEEIKKKDEEIAELKKELHNWRGKASWTGDARDHANDEAPKESTNA